MLSSLIEYHHHESMKAAYLGPTASFSHQAALALFHGTTTQIEALPSFTDIFEAVQSSRFEYGVVPFENSSNGSVVQLLDLLADRQLKYSHVNVCAEYYLRVHHHLLVKRSGQPGAIDTGLDEALKRINKFYTHPQAWGQCSAFLARADCRRIVRQDSSSTAEAARVVSELEEGTSAAIASELAAKEYGLLNLASNIEDKGDNTTRFFVIARLGCRFPPALLRNDTEKSSSSSRLLKNLVSFTIDHESPGALADALSIFKKHDFNLTSINTRPSQIRPWHYIFFAECEQVRQQQHQEDAIKCLISDLDGVALSCRHLGTWKDQLKSS